MLGQKPAASHMQSPRNRLGCLLTVAAATVPIPVDTVSAIMANRRDPLRPTESLSLKNRFLTGEHSGPSHVVYPSWMLWQACALAKREGRLLLWGCK